MSNSITLSSFFDKKSSQIEEILKYDNSIENSDFSKKINIPKIIDNKQVSQTQQNEEWQNIREFFRIGNGENDLSKLTPICLSPYVDSKYIANDYPFWISDKGENSTLRKLLIKLIENIESNSDILSNNIERIIISVNKRINNNSPVDAYLNVCAAIDDISDKLSISGEEGEVFRKDILKLKSSFPNNGVLIPFTINTSYYLLGAALQTESKRKNETLLIKIHEVKNKLLDLLAIESSKSKQDPDKMKSAMSFISDSINFDIMSESLPESGTQEMAENRKQIIKQIVLDLDQAEQNIKNSIKVYIDYNISDNNWDKIFTNAEIIQLKKEQSCEQIEVSKHLSYFEKTFSLIEKAELELSNKYNSEIHDEYFANFSWRCFSLEQLKTISPLIYIVNSSTIIDSDLSNFSKLLSKGHAIKFVVINDSESFNELKSRRELGAIAISHRNVDVMQFSCVNPSIFYTKINELLDSELPGVFNVVHPNNADNLYYWANTSVLSRNSPSFTYKGGIEKKWGSRFNIDNNPQANNIWPEYELDILDKNNNKIKQKFQFTYADFILSSNPSEFKIIDFNESSDELVLLSEYLNLDKQDLPGKIPYIFLVNAENNIVKLAVSYKIILACKERLEYWQYLQSNSGVNNFHVKQSLESAQEELENKANEKVLELQDNHNKELLDVADIAVEKAMDNLSAALLSMDSSVAFSNSNSSTTVEAPNKTEENITILEQEENKEEFTISQEAYIDTALCTSCNECINLNEKLFVYDADKMASIGDINAGTFEELVEAAELCPVGIIHPGEPVNKDEKGLEDLIQRAEKFN